MDDPSGATASAPMTTCFRTSLPSNFSAATPTVSARSSVFIVLSMKLLPTRWGGGRAEVSPLPAGGEGQGEGRLLNDLQELICELVAIESVNPDLVASGSG